MEHLKYSADHLGPSLDERFDARKRSLYPEFNQRNHQLINHQQGESPKETD